MVDAAIVRGGTSRGVVLGLDNARVPGPERDQLALRLIGRSPVEGLGGGTPITNKVVLVGRSPSADAVLDYIVGNVSSDGGTVDWSGTCGNMTSAVVPYAAATGILDPAAHGGAMRIRNLATGGFVDVSVASDSPDPRVEGAEVRLTTAFLDPGGLVLGRTLPTGNAWDVLELDGESFDFSLVDVTHPYLFLFHAQVVGDRSLEDVTTRERVESIRAALCVRLGLCATAADAASASAAVPRVVLVHAGSRPTNDVRVTAVSMGRFIPSVPVTAALSLAAARKIDGTILGSGPAAGDELVVVGPSGTVRAAATVDPDGRVRSASVQRTAQILMRGRVAL